jgi:hypothetical protein
MKTIEKRLRESRRFQQLFFDQQDQLDSCNQRSMVFISRAEPSKESFL